MDPRLSVDVELSDMAACNEGRTTDGVEEGGARLAQEVSFPVGGAPCH